jgi:hypothetical protein
MLDPCISFRKIPKEWTESTSACIWLGNHRTMQGCLSVEIQSPILIHILSSRMHGVNVTPQAKVSYASTENVTFSHLYFILLLLASNFQSVV